LGRRRGTPTASSTGTCARLDRGDRRRAPREEFDMINDRRLWRWLAPLAGLALIVTACGPQASQAPTTGPTSGPATPQPTAAAGAKVVRVLAVAGPETDALINHAADFEKATGITASIEQVARPLWGQRKVRELIEDSGLYDVVMVGGGDDNTWLKYKAHATDLSTLLSADTLAQLINIDKFKTADGKLLGVPQYFNFPMLFYRKDLFADPAEQAAFKAKYGRDLTVPETYDEMYEVAEFFTRPPDLYGFFIGGVDWSIFLDDTYFVYGHGGNYGDEKTGQLTLNSDAQKAAFADLLRFSKFNPPGAETQNFFDGDGQVQSGKVAMYQNWFYIWKTFRAEVPDKIGMAPLVGSGAHLGAFVATIPQAAPNTDDAVKFLDWMLSAAYQKVQALDTGNLPVRQDVLNDPEVRSALVGVEDMEKVLPTLQYNQVTWAGELSAGVGEAIVKVLRGEMTPDQAADWLQDTKFANRKAIE
jgi:ABC-type glycerol-3-phosphate transport system substrate-binding protein